MIKEFVLVDDCDDNYSDLISFDKEVNLKELTEVIQKKKEEMPGEYTNEDIYNAIDELGVAYTIRFLGGLVHIEY